MFAAVVVHCEAEYATPLLDKLPKLIFTAFTVFAVIVPADTFVNAALGAFKVPASTVPAVTELATTLTLVACTFPTLPLVIVKVLATNEPIVLLEFAETVPVDTLVDASNASAERPVTNNVADDTVPARALPNDTCVLPCNTPAVTDVALAVVSDPDVAAKPMTLALVVCKPTKFAVVAATFAVDIPPVAATTPALALETLAVKPVPDVNAKLPIVIPLVVITFAVDTTVEATVPTTTVEVNRFPSCKFVALTLPVVRSPAATLEKLPLVPKTLVTPVVEELTP